MSYRRTRINPSVVAIAKKKVEGPNAPYLVGQELLVDPPNQGAYLPCMPQPNVDNPIFGLTRIPRGAMITYQGLIELAENVFVMHFMYNKNNNVFLGLGTCPSLTLLAKATKSKRPPVNTKKRRLALKKSSPLARAKAQQKHRKKYGL